MASINYKPSIVVWKAAFYALAGAIGTMAVILAAQAITVGVSTPRIPPPNQSGHDFAPGGLLVDYYKDTSAAHSKSRSGNNYSDNQKNEKEEFRVLLLGDSPVEGIGNDSHHVAMGGQTAMSFSRMLQRPVRYWSYGKSGLTAEGIEREMVPLLRRTAGKYNKIDTVVISCGVNNVLWGQSATAFGREVSSLLDAVDDACGDKRTTVLVLALLDFSHMPFLPWPLSGVTGWRSRALQKEMEVVVEKRSSEKRTTKDRSNTVAIAHMPEVAKVLDGSHHPLLEHLDPDVISTLKIDDFFAHDGFHPAKHGTAMVGNLLAKTYEEIVTCNAAAHQG
jgi:lysophospholipase L1-like esterase